MECKVIVQETILREFILDDSKIEEFCELMDIEKDELILDNEIDTDYYDELLEFCNDSCEGFDVESFENIFETEIN